MKRKIWLGMLVAILVFGMALTGCSDNSLALSKSVKLTSSTSAFTEKQEITVYLFDLEAAAEIDPSSDDFDKDPVAYIEKFISASGSVTVAKKDDGSLPDSVTANLYKGTTRFGKGGSFMVAIADKNGGTTVIKSLAQLVVVQYEDTVIELDYDDFTAF